MTKKIGGGIPVKIEYECWKCDKWHETESIRAIRFARVRIVTGSQAVTLPNLHRLYAWKYQHRHTLSNLFWNKFGKCTDCGKIKLRNNLWYAEPNAAWCQACM